MARPVHEWTPPEQEARRVAEEFGSTFAHERFREKELFTRAHGDEEAAAYYSTCAVHALMLGLPKPRKRRYTT